MQTAASSCSDRRAGFDALFHARSVALIGVSGDLQKLNGAPLSNLRRNGFKGKIYPVNPRYREIDGLTCYPTIADVPEAPDVVLSMVQASETPDVVRACGRRGVRAVVVLSAGFEETEDGKDLAADLAKAAQEYSITLIGPNCEGLWSVAAHLILTFGSAAKRDILYHAPIAIISQSGAVAGSIARQLQDSGHGCAYVVSVGNETCTDALEVMAWIIEQPDVKVIALFVEGLRNGARLLDLAERARQRGIHIVTLKTGNSSIGRAAAGSHTGKLASSYAVYKGVFEQAGIIQVEGIVDLVDAVEIFSAVPLPRTVTAPQPGVAVFSIPGGTRALTADLCETRDVPLALFNDKTLGRMAEVLPAFGQVQNPTDLTGQVLSKPQLFSDALKIVAADPATEAMIVQLANRGPHDVREYGTLIADVAAQLNVPVIVSFLADTMSRAERTKLLQRGVTPARDPVDAVRYLDWLYSARRNLQRPTRAVDGAGKVVVAPKNTGWGEAETFLRSAGIATPASIVLKAEDITAERLRDLSGPYAAKALPDQAEHKTEMNLVELGLSSPEAVDAAVARLRKRLGIAAAPILVQEMVQGVEAVLAVVDDEDFGPVLVIGTGGKGIELWGDVAYLALPATTAEIDNAIDGLKLAELLQGFRGAPQADRPALVAAAVALQSAALPNWTHMSEAEINPLIVRPAGVAAVDILIRLRT